MSSRGDVWFASELDQISRPWQKWFEAKQIKSFSEGLFELLPGGYLFVDEAESGRMLLFAENGDTVAEFVNRASDGEVYYLGWSRIISREFGEKVMASLRNAECG